MANITMSVVVLVVVLFLTAYLTNMPVAVLAAIVFMIGLGLVGLQGSAAHPRGRVSEFLIACFTAHRGVRLGSRAGHHPRDHPVDPRARPPRLLAEGLPRGRRQGGRADIRRRRRRARESLPGLIVFRFDARLFYANASLFVDDIRKLIDGAPTPVRWLVLDCSSIGDIDYSASLNIADLIKALHDEHRVFALAAVDPTLMEDLHAYRTLESFDNAHIYPTVEEAVAAFRAAPVEGSTAGA